MSNRVEMLRAITASVNAGSPRRPARRASRSLSLLRRAGGRVAFAQLRQRANAPCGDFLHAATKLRWPDRSAALSRTDLERALAIAKSDPGALSLPEPLLRDGVILFRHERSVSLVESFVGGLEIVHGALVE